MGSPQEKEILIIVFMGALGMLLLILSIGLFVLIHQRKILKARQRLIAQEFEHQSKMIKLQIESQEQERKRIGADLHDSLGSLLWGIKVNTSLIQRTVNMNDAALTAFRDLSQILEESIETVRRIAWELTPESFHYSGLSASVIRLCERLGGKGIDISFNEENRYFWNDERALQVFRIIQELISNTFKHSGATSLTVSMKWSEQQLKIIVSDNGSGFKSDNDLKGIGLWNINQRTKQLNGKILIGNAPINTGANFFLEIPLIP